MEKIHLSSQAKKDLDAYINYVNQGGEVRKPYS